jgi:murein DD-endopeptidase MepM/ murein hydrolase activator NlpD
MAGSRMAGFAEHRTYYYNNAEIDQQVHLGIDLASTKRADIKAANRGNVVFAEYLGIYGNTIILDHGQGIFSLYSHLSQIGVAVGELVDKGAIIALSGASGMAGGDHLHFSVLINGIFVTPLEWWDKQWLQLNIEDILYGRKDR